MDCVWAPGSDQSDSRFRRARTGRSTCAPSYGSLRIDPPLRPRLTNSIRFSIRVSVFQGISPSICHPCRRSICYLCRRFIPLFTPETVGLFLAVTSPWTRHQRLLLCVIVNEHGSELYLLHQIVQRTAADDACPSDHMRVSHRCLQPRVSHHLLDRTNIGPGQEEMGRK